MCVENLLVAWDCVVVRRLTKKTEKLFVRIIHRDFHFHLGISESPSLKAFSFVIQLPVNQLRSCRIELLKIYGTVIPCRHAGWSELAHAHLSDPNSDSKCSRHVSTKTHNWIRTFSVCSDSWSDFEEQKSFIGS